MGKKTGLYQCHESAGARFVDFGGWDMPLHYGSQIDEHHVVRTGAGVFDVSHMVVVDVDGADSSTWLSHLLANDISRLKNSGKGLYSCMLNSDGGVIDDLIVYWQGGQKFRLVVNAARRDADLNWMRSSTAGQAVEIREREDLAMLAVQGPQAITLAAPLLPPDLSEEAVRLGSFEATASGDVFVARTGYTGEDGWEIILPPQQAVALWNDLLAAGIRPCGLGARDTLRLEAGLNLYGQDMTESTTPLVSGLGWTVAWQPEARRFTGREALEQQRQAGAGEKFVGLVLEERGVMRAGQRVVTSAGDGQVTSGGFSPTLERSIALARIPGHADEKCEVEIRSKLVPAKVVKPPFVKHGQIMIQEK